MEYQISQANFVLNCECSKPLNAKRKYRKDEILEEKEEIKKDTSRKLRDYICPKCGFQDEFFVQLDETVKCEKCKSKMELIEVPQHTSFKLTYDPKKDITDWQGNSSQYWNAVKEERRRGNKVKGLYEK